MGETKKSIEDLKRDLDAAKLPAFRAKILLDLSDEVFYSAPAEAEEYLQQAIQNARVGKDVESICRGFNNLAYLRNQSGRLAEGRKLAEKSLRIARLRKLTRVEASANNVLGTIMFQQGELRAAIGYYEECLKLSRASAYGRLAS